MATKSLPRHSDVRFVSPDPKPQFEIIPANDALPMLPTAQTSVQLNTTYTDRAKGFQLVSLPISVAFGLGALVVAAVGFSVPMFSIAALAVFWLAFLGWWLLGWAIHHLASPDGVALLQAILMYRYIRHDQKSRLDRYREVRRHE